MKKGDKAAVIALTGAGNFLGAMKMLDEARKEYEAAHGVRIELSLIKFRAAGGDAVINVGGNNIPAPDLWLAEGVVTEVV